MEVTLLDARRRQCVTGLDRLAKQSLGGLQAHSYANPYLGITPLSQEALQHLPQEDLRSCLAHTSRQLVALDDELAANEAALASAAAAIDWQRQLASHSRHQADTGIAEACLPAVQSVIARHPQLSALVERREQLIQAVNHRNGLLLDLTTTAVELRLRSYSRLPFYRRAQTQRSSSVSSLSSGFSDHSGASSHHTGFSVTTAASTASSSSSSLPSTELKLAAPQLRMVALEARTGTRIVLPEHAPALVTDARTVPLSEYVCASSSVPILFATRQHLDSLTFKMPLPAESIVMRAARGQLQRNSSEPALPLTGPPGLAALPSQHKSSRLSLIAASVFRGNFGRSGRASQANLEGIGSAPVPATFKGAAADSPGAGKDSSAPPLPGSATMSVAAAGRQDSHSTHSSCSGTSSDESSRPDASRDADQQPTVIVPLARAAAQAVAMADTLLPTSSQTCSHQAMPIPYAGFSPSDLDGTNAESRGQLLAYRRDNGAVSQTHTAACIARFWAPARYGADKTMPALNADAHSGLLSLQPLANSLETLRSHSQSPRSAPSPVASDNARAPGRSVSTVRQNPAGLAQLLQLMAAAEGQQQAATESLASSKGGVASLPSAPAGVSAASSSESDESDPEEQAAHVHGEGQRHGRFDSNGNGSQSNHAGSLLRSAQNTGKPHAPTPLGSFSTERPADGCITASPLPPALVDWADVLLLRPQSGLLRVQKALQGATPLVLPRPRLSLSYMGQIPRKVDLVDGGVISNFPFDLFVEPGAPECMPTIGFRVGVKRRRTFAFTSFLGFVWSCLQSLRQFSDGLVFSRLPSHDANIREVEEPAGIKFSKFDLTVEEEMLLFNMGVDEALRFLYPEANVRTPAPKPPKPAFDWQLFKQQNQRLKAAAQAQAGSRARRRARPRATAAEPRHLAQTNVTMTSSQESLDDPAVPRPTAAHLLDAAGFTRTPKPRPSATLV